MVTWLGQVVYYVFVNTSDVLNISIGKVYTIVEYVTWLKNGVSGYMYSHLWSIRIHVQSSICYAPSLLAPCYKKESTAHTPT